MSKLYVVGIGPGEYDQMTIKAIKALENSDIIVGYSVYVELIREHFSTKNFYDTPMMKEIDRCRYAVEKAIEGQNVAVVCSGDAGVYGMASLIYEIADGKGVDIEVIAGITAACSGGAMLGAPLSHDFAVISFSDLLTPFEEIQRRVECASIGDMCMAIYNPSSKKRADYLRQMCEIMLRHKKQDTICGVARNIGREGASFDLMTLTELQSTTVDMFTTVYIGNSQTKIIDGKMVTPRGYSKKGTL